MGREHAHQLFHDAVWTQQGLPAVWTSSPQAIVKRCAQRVCQAGNAEWLLAAFLFDARAVTSWDGAVGGTTSSQLFGHLAQAQQLFPFGLLAAAGHRAIQMRLGSEIGTDQMYGGSEQATARSDAALEI